MMAHESSCSLQLSGVSVVWIRYELIMDPFAIQTVIDHIVLIRIEEDYIILFAEAKYFSSH